MLRLSLRVSAGLLLTGCGILPVSAPPQLPLLPPQALGQSIEREQILHATHGGRSVTLQCRVRAVPETVSAYCFTALGQRAFMLHYDGATLATDSALPGIGEEIPPRSILADLQLAWWPLEKLQEAAGPQWQIADVRPGLRRVRHDGELYAEVHYPGKHSWDGRLWLVNFAHRYSLDIESKPRHAP